jgi:hypothetical protein
MEPDFSYLAAALTTEELTERIDNRKKYLPETVEAAVSELQYRKHEFSDDELRTINDGIDLQRKNAAMVDSRLGFFNSTAKNVIVKDAEAPLMYSRQALYVFTVLCGALFGSIMLAINIGKTKKPGNAVWVILFGIAFTALQIFVVSTYARPGSGSSGAIIGGIIAAYTLDFLFWKPFIGYSTFYRSRPIWIPLIIALVVFGLLIAAVIIGGKAG